MRNARILFDGHLTENPFQWLHYGRNLLCAIVLHALILFDGHLTGHPSQWDCFFHNLLCSRKLHVSILFDGHLTENRLPKVPTALNTPFQLVRTVLVV